MVTQKAQAPKGEPVFHQTVFVTKYSDGSDEAYYLVHDSLEDIDLDDKSRVEEVAVYELKSTGTIKVRPRVLSLEKTRGK